MYRTIPMIFLLTSLAFVNGCGDVGGVRDGDVVSPVLNGSPRWSAGKFEQISIRLKASHPDSPEERALGFTGIPSNANPTAQVTFFIGGEPQTPVDVPLNHRC
jgi:hypothetical protein